MQITLFPSFVLVFIGIFCHISLGDFDTAKPVQIITPVNHTFHLELNNLKPILEANDIKDRHVVVVSIAGAFRKGKSFLSNFFIRYLYARYKIHDMTDWLGENKSSVLGGFKWRGGRKPETIGIWMWSDIFTHDFENGEKVAIILLDTQGTFDSRSSLQDCTTTFALSMMLSSVQCYNVMQNIQENDLQHLELFTEYGRMVLDETNEKPFQYLLFIIRDWPFADETDGYGWGETIITEILTGDEEQTTEMRQLRQRINSSFDEIGAFLLPYPGPSVALKKNFNGDLKQIDPEFLKHVKTLVSSIFAPEKLVLKRINGETVRARDLIEYMQAYLNVFNGKALPEPKTVLWATAETSNLILFNDVMDSYVDSMQNALRDVEPYFSEKDLLETHETAKNESISQFLLKRKLGNEALIASFLHRIENATEKQFLDFKWENDVKRKIFIDTANLHNENLIIEIQTDYEMKILNQTESIESLNAESLKQLLNKTKEGALNTFNAEKMGSSEIASSFAEELQQNLADFQTAVEAMLQSYKDSLHVYSDLMMRNELNQLEMHVSQNDLTEMHQNARKAAIEQFQLRSHDTTAKLASYFQQKIETDIEKKYKEFVRENEAKQEPEVISQYSGLFKTGGLAAGGAAVGGMIAGPAGSAIGGIFGAAVGYLIL